MKMVGTIKTFISYSSQDSTYIHRLHRSLDTVGANPYVAEWWLEAGQPLAEKMKKSEKELAEEVDLLDTMLSSLVELLEEKGIVTQEEWEKRIKERVSIE